MEQAQDWLSLPEGVLDLVIKKLELSSDFIRFSMVCKLWYNAAKYGKDILKCRTSIREPPMLLFHTREDNAWNLYSIVDNRVLDSIQFELPDIYRWFCGSSKGWLIATDKNFRVNLINPFMRIKGRKAKENSIIHLPSLTPPPGMEEDWLEEFEHIVFKATISADPIMNPNDCIVVLIRKNPYRLAFIRLNKDISWTYISDYRLIQEVAYVDRKFYAADNKARVLSFDIASEFRSSDIATIGSDTLKGPKKLYTRVYLVDSYDGRLLVAHRYLHIPDHKRVTKGFGVFEFDFYTSKWIRKDTLSDCAFFLGDNSSICVQATKFPGCKPNHIYFNHDRDMAVDIFNPRDFGVYDFRNHKFVVLYDKYAYNLINSTLRYPIWVVPTLNML